MAWGKVTGWTVRFLELPEPRRLPGGSAAELNDPSTPPAPQSHSLLSSCSPTATFSKSALALTTPAPGWVIRTLPTTGLAAGAPALTRVGVAVW